MQQELITLSRTGHK